MRYSIIKRENNENIPLSTSEVTVIGRGSFGIIDKRISKRHGEITCTDDNHIQIKSCHKNPIFYQKQNDSNKNILYENSSVSLCNNDIFLLLPDSHEFIVKINAENSLSSSSTFRVRNITEINDNLETGEIPVTLSQVMKENDLPNENKPQEVSSSSSSNFVENRKRSHTSQENDNSASSDMNDDFNDDAKKPKIEPILDENVASTSSLETPTIKPDPDSTNKQTPNSPTPSVSNVKQEPDSSSLKTEDNSPNASNQQHSAIRQSCDFGVRCFRHTAEHRRDFAHPGDSDYRRPTYPPAAPNSPRCPFWAACYRRNPDHFRQFEHPPPSVYNPVQQPSAIIVQPQQRRVINVAIYDNNDYDNDDEDDGNEDIFYSSDDTDVDQDYEVDAESNDEDEDEDEGLEDDENNLEE